MVTATGFTTVMGVGGFTEDGAGGGAGFVIGTPEGGGFAAGGTSFTTAGVGSGAGVGCEGFVTATGTTRGFVEAGAGDGCGVWGAGGGFVGVFVGEPTSGL